MPVLRDFFIGQWERYGGDGTFFPDKIILEVDPNSSDGLLATFNFKCAHASCTATKVLAGPVSIGTGSTHFVTFQWFHDTAPANYSYVAIFQEEPKRLVQNSLKEISTNFSVRTAMGGRTADLAGTNDNYFRYFVPFLGIPVHLGTSPF